MRSLVIVQWTVVLMAYFLGNPQGNPCW